MAQLKTEDARMIYAAAEAEKIAHYQTLGGIAASALLTATALITGLAYADSNKDMQEAGLFIPFLGLAAILVIQYAARGVHNDLSSVWSRISACEGELDIPEDFQQKQSRGVSAVTLMNAVTVLFWIGAIAYRWKALLAFATHLIR